MYVPRGKLLALVMIVVAASLVTATGAFSTVQTERKANVQVTGDANAYLGLEPAKGEDSNGDFASQNEKGKLTIEFNKESSTEKIGKGVNPDSITTFDNVFVVRNQGTQDVKVTVKGNNEKRISIYKSDGGGEINGVSISPGESIKVGIKIDASGKSSGNSFTEKITITANNPDSAKTPSPPSSGSGGSSDSGSDKSKK